MTFKSVLVSAALTLVMISAAAAGQLKVPLRTNEMIVWSVPGHVDHWLPDEVAVLDNAMAQFLVDTNGMVLYVFRCDLDDGAEQVAFTVNRIERISRKEICERSFKIINHPVAKGQPRCVAACAEEHPPLFAPANAVGKDDWTVVMRDDGKRQWAYKGYPLYTFRLDTVQGFPAGNNTGGIWENVRADGSFGLPSRPAPPPLPNVDAVSGVKVQATLSRTLVLADYRGMTLYTSGAQDMPADAVRWKPLPAPMFAGANGDWTVVRRDDGIRQWALKGKPVYTCASDVKPGDVNCSDATWTALAGPQLEKKAALK